MDRNTFIEQMAGYVRKCAPLYNIKVNSAIIAQACNECDFGNRKLATEHHNYFGMKAGTRWKGRTVNYKTWEVYDGRKETIRDDFRSYDSMEEGVRGYFEFIQLPRYKNLKGITDPLEYLLTIKSDGYATDPQYVSNCMKIIEQYDLAKYDNPVPEATHPAPKTADAVIAQAEKWLGRNEADGSHRIIIDTYNMYHRPLPRGYKVKYTDSWCATFVSAVGIEADCVELIGRECSCEEFIKIFKSMGIWIEDGTVTPERGWIILYNWDDKSQPNDGHADHIGFVVCVNGDDITVIEGNKNDAVEYRHVKVGEGFIRGYAAPRYKTEVSVGFKREGKRWRYQLEDGSYATNDWYWLTEKTGGTSGWYLFSTDGYMLTGHQTFRGESFYLCTDKSSDEGKCMVTDSRGVLRVPTGYDFVNHKYII